MSLFDKLAEVEDVAACIESRLGLPQRRYLLLRHQYLNDARTATVIEDHLVCPSPFITSAPPRLQGLLIGNEETAVSITSTDLYVELSRVTPYSAFVRTDKKRAVAIVDPPVAYGQVQYSNRTTKEIEGGIRCRIIHVEDDDDTLWKLILRKERD